jgi:hypothetical protein
MTNELLDRAAGFATCAILATAGSRLVGIGVSSLAAGGVGTVPLTLGSLSLLGAGFACQEIAVDGSPPSSQEGCQEVDGTGAVAVDQGAGLVPLFGTSNVPASNAIEITNSSPFLSGTTGRWTLQVTWRWTGGEDQYVGNSYDTEAEARSVKWGLIPNEGSTCKRGPDPLPPLPPAATDPIPYTDPVTNCNYNIELLGFVEQFAGGTQDPVFLIESSNDVLRSNGGVVGGCNFAPTVYYGGSGGGGDFGGGDGAPPFPYIPGDGDDGRPNWLNTLASALAGAAAAIAADAVADAIQAAFATEYPGLIYRMVSVCEKDASGEPISEAVEVPIPDLRAPDAQLARLDAIVELLQASKNFKQPVCPNERPKLEGDWRTISFRSTQSSPYGKSCLRKRFRYRSVSGIGLGELVDHWKDFTWTTGPVIVTHTGHTWGSLKVWAATADEGKRVIQHAAREAGFDADQVGEWGISNSSGSRYGVSLPVKVDTTGGYYWITNRDGSNQRPIVALTSDI